MAESRICFIVMPFRPELNFLFLFLQRYLAEHHGLRVRRGDTSVLTKALMDKVDAEIQAADIIIGDITYGSPNVFYELGLARAYAKPIIFMTQDDPATAPVDLRHFEFIQYDLARDHELLARLDNAIQNTLGSGHEVLFAQALELLKRFNADTESNYSPAALEEFRARVIRGERVEGVPAVDDPRLVEFLLPKIVNEATDITALRKLDRWLSTRRASSVRVADRPARGGRRRAQ